MAISVNDGTNPSKVIYNGKECTEVWYKSSPDAESIKVWPDNAMFNFIGINRSPSQGYKGFNPTNIYIKTSSKDDPVTLTLTNQSGGSSVLAKSFNTKAGDGFRFSAYGAWWDYYRQKQQNELPGSVSILVNRPTAGPVDDYYNCRLKVARNSLDKAITVIYENGKYWLKNVYDSPINLSAEIPDIGTIDKLQSIEFDIGQWATPRGVSPVFEIRFYIDGPLRT